MVKGCFFHLVILQDEIQSETGKPGMFVTSLSNFRMSTVRPWSSLVLCGLGICRKGGTGNVVPWKNK